MMICIALISLFLHVFIGKEILYSFIGSVETGQWEALIN